MAMAPDGQPKRLRRSDSFLGVHFDFHAGDDCTEIGRTVSPEMVEAIIDAVQPDYLQTDCKGHRGFSSYPTKVGNPAPGFTQDVLRIWRDVTARRGVALYMHYSGVWDSEALKHHPEWARIDEAGKADPNNTSVYGPYADELLIPQLQELANDYEVDGVWIDGECWAACQDYSPSVVDAFEQSTGMKLDPIPTKLGDPLFYEFTEFCRQGFRDYLRHYVDTLHASNPDFQIASNWAFSSFMPEPVCADVDFISGDYTLLNSLNSARLEGRCMQRQGKPWDLMAWAFSSTWEDECRSTKSVPQLEQEAAAVLSLGGGFQAYFTQKRDGGVRLWQMKLMGEVARFCRARQELCHKAESVPGASVALLLSSDEFYRLNQRVFSPWNGELDPLKGVLQALLESQFHVEIVSEHHLKGRMHEYPVIVNPEWAVRDGDFKAELLDYVSAGGNLVLVGPTAAKCFQAELDVRLGDESDKLASRWVEFDGWLGGLATPVCSAQFGPRARQSGHMYRDNDTTSTAEAAASVAAFGKGSIAATYFNMGKRYGTGATQEPRRLLASLIHELVPSPMVTVTGSQYVDVTVMSKASRLLVNLVNTAGPHADDRVYVFSDIPPVGPLSVTVRMPVRPSSVSLQPSGLDLQWSYSEADSSLSIAVPLVAIHEVVVIEP